MAVFDRRCLIGLAFIGLIMSAEAIHMGSRITVTKRLHGRRAGATQEVATGHTAKGKQKRIAARHAAKVPKKWTNSELMQLKGQVNSLSLHIKLLEEAIVSQDEAQTELQSRKTEQEVHNCRETFTKITQFSAPTKNDYCAPNEIQFDCVSQEVLDELSESIMSLFGPNNKAFFDKMSGSLDVLSKSKDNAVKDSFKDVENIIQGSGHCKAEEGDQARLQSMSSCLTAIDEELIIKTESTGRTLETGLVETGRRTHGAMASDGPGSLFVKSIIAFFVGVTVISVGFLLTIALSLIFGLIYMVASFLRLKCITDRQDKVVEDIFSNVMKGLQATFGFLGEGMVIATQQRRGPNIFSAVAGFLRL